VTRRERDGGGRSFPVGEQALEVRRKWLRVVLRHGKYKMLDLPRDRCWMGVPPTAVTSVLEWRSQHVFSRSDKSWAKYSRIPLGVSRMKAELIRAKFNWRWALGYRRQELARR